MTDLAALGLRVEGTQNVDAAEKSLDRFASTAGRAERATDSFKSGVSQAERATSSMVTAASAAGAAIAGIGMANLARETLQLANAWSALQSRLRLATGSTGELQKATSELFSISQRARVGLEATSELYASLSRSTQSLGVSQDRLLRVTETISKSLTISGASAAAAEAALTQLGQGFSSGALRGEELNSLLEQTPRLAQAIADGLGVTIGELRVLGKEGKLTADAVFTALEGQREVIESEFSTMTKTVSQAFVQLRNAVFRYVGEADQATGVSRALADAVSLAAENIDVLAKAAGAVAAVIGLALVGSVGSYVVTSTAAAASSIAMAAGLSGMSAAALAGSVAVRGLGLALAFFGGPIGIAIAAVAAGLGLIAMESMKARAEAERLADEMGGTKQALDAYEEAAGQAATATGNAREKALAHAEAMRVEAAAAITAARALREKQVALAEAQAAEKQTREDRVTSTWIGAMAGAGSGLPTGALASAIPEASAARKVAQAKTDVEVATKKQAEAEARYAKILAGSTVPAIEATTAVTGGLARARREADDAMERGREATASYIAALEHELAVIGLSSNAIRRLAADREIEAALKRGDVDSAVRIKQLILEIEKTEELAEALEYMAKARKAAIDAANDTGPLRTIPMDVPLEQRGRLEELIEAFEEARQRAEAVRWTVDDIFYAIRNNDWVGAFAGLLRVLEQVKIAFDKNASAADRMSAATSVISAVGGAIGGKAGGALSGAASGAMAGWTLSGGNPIVAAAGAVIGGIGGLLSGDKAKKQAKAEAEARDIANARAVAQQRANQQAELELRILELSGDEVGALAKRREAELAALDGANRALAEHVHALEDWAAAVGKAKDAVAKAEDDLREAYEAEKKRLEGIIGSVQGARERLSQAYQRERGEIESTITSLRTAVKGFADFRNEIDMLSAANDPGRQYSYAQNRFAGASDENVIEFGRAFAEASRSSSATDLDYQRDLAAVRRRTDEAAKTAQGQLTTAERQLAALDALVEPLLGANDNLVSVDEAIRALSTAEQDAAVATAELARLDAQVGALININTSVLTVAQAITNLQTAIAALAAAEAAKPAQNGPAGGYEAVGYAGYVDKNPDLAALYATGSGMARGRSKEEFGAYHWERYGQAEERAYRPFARGGVFTNGIVSEPTTFDMGLMGEAGSEAIMPLTMGPNGLGVRASGGDNSRLEALVSELKAEVAALRVTAGKTAANTKNMDERGKRQEFNGVYVRGQAPEEPIVITGTVEVAA